MNFIVVADPTQAGLDMLLRKTYGLYADYVLKNPFYGLDMPIRCELFDVHLREYVESFVRGGGGRTVAGN
jgi:trafficking protein particle complex subunit 4